MSGRAQIIPIAGGYKTGMEGKLHDAFSLNQRAVEKTPMDFPLHIFNGKRIRIIAELPDVNETDLRLDLNNDILFIFAGPYHKKISLPHHAETITWKAHGSGILEITLT
jgi:HSP20 family molecular chaperone IbpA